MKKVSLDTWIQLLGMVGLLGGLVFVGLEMQQNQTIALAAQANARTEMLLSRSLVIFEGRAELMHKVQTTPVDDLDEFEKWTKRSLDNWVYSLQANNYFQYQLFTIREGISSIDVSKYDSALEFSIPAIVGIKFSVSNSLVLSFETGIRYSLTDNIDGSNPIGQFESDVQVKHGELYNNDWYVFTGLTLSYTFGRQPCYCKERCRL